jgi:hypothetical protein
MDATTPDHDPAEPGHETTAADIEALYPHWNTWSGADGFCHALRTTGAALTAKGQTWRELLADIAHAEEVLGQGRPSGWSAPRWGAPRS